MSGQSYFSQSERLLYRPLTNDDIDHWTPFFENNKSLPYLGLDLSKDKKTLATHWISKQLERYRSDGIGHLAVIARSNGIFLGTGGILKRELQGQVQFEIAYSLLPSAWNLGYGTEIARQMKNFGINNNIADTFISIIEINNTASIRVAQKNGMKLMFETIYLGMNVYVYGISKSFS